MPQPSDILEPKSRVIADLPSKRICKYVRQIPNIEVYNSLRPEQRVRRFIGCSRLGGGVSVCGGLGADLARVVYPTVAPDKYGKSIPLVLWRNNYLPGDRRTTGGRSNRV